MSEQLDPNKYHVFPRKKRIIILLTISAVILVTIPLLGRLYYGFAINRPSQTSKEVSYEIRRGMSVPEISRDLLEAGAVNSDFLFNLYVYLTGADKNIQAGSYVIPAGTSIVELVDMFSLGKNDISITFLEGWRVEEYAREASSIFENIDYEKFLNLAKPYEGYLFPDTYIFNKEVEEEEMIDFLRNTFDQKTEELLSEEALGGTGLTKEQVVILASIVEREAKTIEERPVISGILVKRYKEGINLDADATVQYAVAINRLCPPTETEPQLYEDILCSPTLDELLELEWWPKEITVDDLEFNSAYNTRLINGLPPTPISSVSISAIESVVDFEPSEYYYYLHDPKGNVHYGVTLEDHNQNISEYLR